MVKVSEYHVHTSVLSCYLDDYDKEQDQNSSMILFFLSRYTTKQKFVNSKVFECWIFSSYYSSFQSRDPSEFILICCFGAQETFLISYLNIFVETEMHFQDSLIKLKRTAFIWKHVFTVTFYRLNAFLLKKSIHFFCFKNQNKKHLSTQNFWMLVYLFKNVSLSGFCVFAVITQTPAQTPFLGCSSMFQWNHKINCCQNVPLFPIYSGAKKYLVSHQLCKFSHLKRWKRPVIFIIGIPQLW